MPLPARSAIVATMFLLLSAPPVLQRQLGGDTGPYIAVTVLLALAALILAAGWRSAPPVPATPPRGSGRVAIGVAAVAVALLGLAAHAWIREILTIPIDPYRGDMLVVVREGLRRMFSGLNPYTIYHVPWPAPLPYGPLLWGPYAVPVWLRMDVRFLGVAGQLFVPAACAVAAFAAAMQGRLTAAAAALLMLGAMAMSVDLVRFASVGHTPVYWPLLALFAWFVARERWHAAALSLGLLVVARTTMIALVPVLLIAVGQRDRPRLAAVSALVALAAVVPFLPFALWDPPALVYALYGSYETVIKTVVWPDATVPHTIGVTGVLLSHGLHRWVEVVQIGVMAVTYVACWLLIRRGRSPLAAMVVALFVFSMTTLWPVYYIYLDVVLLAVAGVLADLPWLRGRTTTVAIFRHVTIVAVVTLAAAGLTTLTMLPLRAAEPPAVTWRDPLIASVVIVRETASPALVDIQVGAGGPAQRLAATFNGDPLPPVELSGGGDRVILAPPERDWQIGANNLELQLASAVRLGRVAVRQVR